ncbi:MAG: hypothetical protein AAB426_05360 [Myxococcota bacterium]
MTDKKRDDNTAQLLASAEALRKDMGRSSAPPSTRKLVRDSERLVGRDGPQHGVRLGWFLGLALLLAGVAGAYLMLGH